MHWLQTCSPGSSIASLYSQLLGPLCKVISSARALFCLLKNWPTWWCKSWWELSLSTYQFMPNKELWIHAKYKVKCLNGDIHNLWIEVKANAVLPFTGVSDLHSLYADGKNLISLYLIISKSRLHMGISFKEVYKIVGTVCPFLPINICQFTPHLLLCVYTCPG